MSNPSIFVLAVAVLVIFVGTAAGATDAELYLSLAHRHFEGREWERAEIFLTKILDDQDTDSEMRIQAAELLEEVIKERAAARRSGAKLRLAEAERLLDADRPGDAEQLLVELLKKIDDPKLLQRADDLLDRAHTPKPAWALVVAVPFLLVAGLVAVICRHEAGRRAARAGRWKITKFDDRTELRMGEMVVERLLAWSELQRPVSVGLLKIGNVEVARVPQLKRQSSPPSVDLLAGLEAILGTKRLQPLGKLWAWLGEWWRRAGPTISGFASTDQGRSHIRLTIKDAGDRKVSFARLIEEDRQRDLPALVDDLTFELYYYIAHDGKLELEDAAKANRLRRGLDALKRHVDSGDPAALEEALPILKPLDSDEAKLFRGVALGLAEQHDEAERLFRQLGADGDSRFRDQARYNEAVSKFRKYKPRALENAIRLLDSLLTSLVGTVDPTPDKLLKSPLAALALAAKANAVAHKPIFWKKLILDVDKEEALDEADRRRAKKQLDSWKSDVDRWTGILGQLRRKVEQNHLPGTWQDLTRRQLLWSTENARGNLALNMARRVLPEEAKQEKLELLQAAQAHFQTCKKTLPPNTATLGNLVTVELSLGEWVEDKVEALDHLDQARALAERVIDMNPKVEYSHYRLVQVLLRKVEIHRRWKQEDQAEEGEEAARQAYLRSPNQPPEIPEFKKLVNASGLAQDQSGTGDLRSWLLRILLGR